MLSRLNITWKGDWSGPRLRGIHWWGSHGNQVWDYLWEHLSSALQSEHRHLLSEIRRNWKVSGKTNVQGAKSLSQHSTPLLLTPLHKEKQETSSSLWDCQKSQQWEASLISKDPGCLSQHPTEEWQESNAIVFLETHAGGQRSYSPQMTMLAQD